MWHGGFHRIAWAHDAGRLVGVPGVRGPGHGRLSSRLRQLLERPLRQAHHNRGRDAVLGVLLPGSAGLGGARASGYSGRGCHASAGTTRARPLFLERPPLFQVAYAFDYARFDTYEQMSRLLSPGALPHHRAARAKSAKSTITSGWPRGDCTAPPPDAAPSGLWGMQRRVSAPH